MNPHDTQLIRPGLHPASVDGAWALAPAGVQRRGAEEADEPQPLHKMHRLLRGRYKLAITLSLLCGAALATAGYLIPKPQYRSDGGFEIKPNIASLTDNASVMPFYTQYVQTQVNLIQQPRVIDLAMEQPGWKNTFSAGSSAAAVKAFVEALDVQYIPGSFVIRVSFTDPNPARASAAVNAVLKAYTELYGDSESKDLQKKLKYVLPEITRLSDMKTSKEAQLRGIADKYGTTDLAAKHSTMMRLALELQEPLLRAGVSLDEIEKAPVAAAGAQQQPAQKAGEKAETPAPMTITQIARLDGGRMQSYVNQRDVAASEVEKYRRQLGPGHPRFREAQTTLQEAQARIDTYAEQFRAENKDMVIPQAQAAQAMAASATTLTPEMIGRLTNNIRILQKKTDEIGKDRMQIEQLQGEIKDVEDQLAAKVRDRDQLKVQSDMIDKQLGRVTQYDADTPHLPSTDARRKLAVLGFLGGGTLPFVFFMLVGLADKRYRYSDETKTEVGNVPLLGILPNLPDLLTDPQQAAIAAHCVHQIRTLLQVGVRTHDRHVYAITSAAPGDGKTSLTLALGLSFAASGSRTLLIDCDLVGGSLTRRLGVHAEDGMLEAMSSRSPLDFVRETDVSDLSILPVGSATMLSAGSFSPAGLRRLIAEARKSYDIVLIDTGPILGSIEAPPVAATADATILCVSRGQQRPAVERSMHHLIAIGAKMAGIVFNRAEARDFEKSVSRFSQRSIRSTDYRSNGNGNGNGGLRLPGYAGDGNGNGNGKGNTASAAVDPVTRAVASEFKGDNGNDPR